MKILVTAFGPFAGRSENASSLALTELKRAFPEIRTRVLPVDSVIAPARLKLALRLIRPDALILLGEAAGSKTIRLETTAWNELDFKIPDIAGRQPAPRAICPDLPPIHRSTHCGDPREKYCTVRLYLSDSGLECLCLLVGIAVGTAVTGGPPRRSVREELPHTALALSRARKRCSG